MEGNIAIDKLQQKKPDDIELMQDIARGGTSELGRLYLRHRERTVALAYRILGNSSRAEDVSQEAFIRVYKAADKYKPDADFRAWLYKIVVNLCIDEKRRMKRSSDLVKSYQYLRNVNKKTKNRNEEKDVAEAVHKAITKLNRRQRIAVVLHRLEGFSHAEISDKTGWSKSSIESLLVRAYKKLRKELINI